MGLVYATNVAAIEISAETKFYEGVVRCQGGLVGGGGGRNGASRVAGDSRLRGSGGKQSGVGCGSDGRGVERGDWFAAGFG